jgi:anti-sigma factor RsiW
VSDQWTDKLSDYLDDELTTGERSLVESHLAVCPECARTLDSLRRVVDRARSARPAPPSTDLWPAIADQIGGVRRPDIATFQRRQMRRLSFTVPQLAAASLLLAAISGGLAWKLHPSAQLSSAVSAPAVAADRPAASPDAAAPLSVEPVSLADAQYDAAVADLQRAVARGRGRLDATTIAIVEHNLQIIDQAIEQARTALEADPANGYLSSHLIEARRRKLDLLRRTAALTSETN